MEDVRPPHKVTDYSSSSEESGTTDEEDDDAEQEGAEEPTSGPEDTRAASVPLSVREDECPRGLPRGLGGKEPACQCRRCGFDLLPVQEMRLRSLGRKDPRRRKWRSTPVFLPGESHGQRSLVGYSAWGRTESDTAEHALTSVPPPGLLSCWDKVSNPVL